MQNKKEKEMGREILLTLTEITQTPTDNLARFKVLKRKLAKVIARYKSLTGSDRLLHGSPSYYGLEGIPRRHGEE